MNEEFKKLSQGNVTRYVLESATSIGSSSIASMPMPVGGTRKRGDNLITQEADKKTVPASTPRNFVAKNAKTAGAGAHKDKSKTIPRKEKHKKPYMEALQARLDQLKSKVAEADSPAQLDEFLPALAAGAGALARGAAAAGGAAIKGAQAVGGAIKQGVQSLAPRVASGAQAAGRAISKVPAAAEKKVIQGAEVLNALVPGGIFNPDGSVKGSQYLTKYLTPQQIQQAQQQGVTEGSEQQFMIYFVVPEHDDYPDRKEPTERTIVVANSLKDAVIKFKAETPEAYIKDVVAMKQGVAEGLLNELTGYGSDKKYDYSGTHKRYEVYVSKQKFNNLYFIAVAENPRTLEAKFKAKGNNPQEAVNNLKLEIDKEIDVATKVSGQAILDFNVEFAKDILEMSTDVFYAKIIVGPRLVIAGPEMMEYPDIMRDEGFKPSAIRTYKGGEGTTKLPGVQLSSKAAAAANLIANGRYVLGNETVDKDGNRVFELNFDSVVQAKNDRMRLRAPALTVGTNRLQGVAEAPMSAAARWQRAMDRQRAKSDASLARTPSSIPKPEPKKDEKIAEKLKTGPTAHFTPKDAHVKRGQFVGGDAVSENVENIMSNLINKIIVNEAISNNRK